MEFFTWLDLDFRMWGDIDFKVIFLPLKIPNKVQKNQKNYTK
jgi:hypothetical protein